MANWGNVKIGKNIKVISHERVEDTEPEIYCQRGEHFFKQGKFLEAETEYLKAVKFSGKDDHYIGKLLVFYYSTKRKDFEKKADKIYPDWWWRQGENKFVAYGMIAFICFFISYAGCVEHFLSLLLACIPLLYGASYWLINNKKIFMNGARGKLRESYNLLLLSSEFFSLKVVIVQAIWTVILLIVSYGMGISKWSNAWGIAAILTLLNKIVAIGGAVGYVIFFNKMVTVLQDWGNKRKWKKYSRKVFWRRFLICVRIMGTIFPIVFEIMLMQSLSH